VAKWPKVIPELTAEENDARDKWMTIWHEVLPKKYGVLEKFNHGYPVRYREKSNEVILEIGAGLGEHIAYEPQDWAEYHCVELRSNMAEQIKRRFPQVQVHVGNCQETLPFASDYFDRVIAVHVLEHLPDLPAALNEIFRVVKPNGQFMVVIPCEGGLLYKFARHISSRRIWNKYYPKMDYYNVVMKNEHINFPSEIQEEIARKFNVQKRTFFPCWLPNEDANLVIGLMLTPRK